MKKIRTLVKGINPKVNKALAEAAGVISKLKKIQKGEVIQLAAEGLPQDSPQKVSIPGISLPTETISDGEQAEAKLPPLTVNVDGRPRRTGR